MKFIYVAILLMMYINCFLYVCSIQCYQCRSDLQASCEKRLAEEYLINCQDNYKKLSKKIQEHLQLAGNKSVRSNAYCRKLYQKLLFTPKKTEIIIRECGYIHGNTDHCYKNRWADSEIIACECRSDGCNKAGLSRHKAQTMLISIFYCMISCIISRITF